MLHLLFDGLSCSKYTWVDKYSTRLSAGHTNRQAERRSLDKAQRARQDVDGCLRRRRGPTQANTCRAFRGRSSAGLIRKEKVIRVERVTSKSTRAA